MKKTVLLIANTTGCLINFRHGLIKQLLKEEYDVQTLAPFYSNEAYSKNAAENLKTWGVLCNDIVVNSKGMNPIEDLKLVGKYVKEFKRIKPDIILSYTIKANIYGSVAARKVGIPIVTNITGLGNLYANPRLLTKVADLLYKWAFRKTQKVFFQNRDDMELFLSRKNLRKEQCGILPGSGINLELFKPEPMERNDNKLKFLVIARLIWDKGIKHYIEAIEILKPKYPNVEFQILGELGIDNPAAIPKELVDQWIDRKLINYLGTSSNVREQIKDVDCMILPSMYREGVPRTLIEGAAMGKPIITTDNVGCRDIVTHEYNGYLCKKGDTLDLAEKIERFINLTNAEREELGSNGRKKVIDEFDEEIVINKYMNIIKTIN